MMGVSDPRLPVSLRNELIDEMRGATANVDDPSRRTATSNLDERERHL